MRKQSVYLYCLMAVAILSGCGVEGHGAQGQPCPLNTPAAITYEPNEAQMQAASDNALPCYQAGHGHAVRSVVAYARTMSWYCSDGKVYTVKL